MAPAPDDQARRHALGLAGGNQLPRGQRFLPRESRQNVRLPSEDEWYRLLAVSGLSELADDTPAPANIPLDHWALSCPVSTFAHGPFYDVVGNVWQWTETPTYPFDGFAVHPTYDNFTTPTLDDRHNLIKGGSWSSCGNEARHASRYAFRRHFFQHAGFHYGDEYFGIPQFSRVRWPNGRLPRWVNARRAQRSIWAARPAAPPSNRLATSTRSPASTSRHVSSVPECSWRNRETCATP